MADHPQLHLLYVIITCTCYYLVFWCNIRAFVKTQDMCIKKASVVVAAIGSSGWVSEHGVKKLIIELMIDCDSCLSIDPGFLESASFIIC